MLSCFFLLVVSFVFLFSSPQGELLIFVDAYPCDAPAVSRSDRKVSSVAPSDSTARSSATWLARSTPKAQVTGAASALPTPTSDKAPKSDESNWFMLRVEVRDSGIGISPAAQKRLFAPFSQAHREINGKYGGTGQRRTAPGTHAAMWS